jgi:hypothetical protein
MEIYYETAMWLWRLRFGEEMEAEDRKGRKILKNAYRQNGSDYGWNIYYNLPSKPDGPCHLRYFEIVHIITYAEKTQAEYIYSEIGGNYNIRTSSMELHDFV